jgi:hypothetical protein
MSWMAKAKYLKKKIKNASRKILNFFVSEVFIKSIIFSTGMILMII